MESRADDMAGHSGLSDESQSPKGKAGPPPASSHDEPAFEDLAPHVSTVLGPLPEAVPAGQTRDLNDAVHSILIIGLVASSLLLVVGLILDALTGKTLSTATLPPGEALARTLELRPSGFLSLGLLVLLATPIVRVVGSIIVFLWERDWLYMAITLFVLMVMLLSVLLGHG
jgi:uncharacterized membrane protein